MPMNFTREQIDQIGRIAGLASKLQDRCELVPDTKGQARC